MLDVRRRAFIRLLGGAAASWPLAARAQQAAMPAVGLLRSTPAALFTALVAALRQGLGDEGFVEGRNVAIEQRYADNQLDCVVDGGLISYSAGELHWRLSPGRYVCRKDPQGRASP